MEPISTVLVGYAADKIVAIGESVIKRQVIDRWSRHRAHKFLEAFCTELIDLSQSDEDIQNMLKDLLSDDVRSEVLFDAYRSVCLTKSRSTGPRVIALLTAELVIAGQIASEEDEAIFSAAEEFGDAEFEQLIDYISEVEAKLVRASKEVIQENGGFRIMVEQQTTTSSWHSRDGISLAPLDLASYLGPWALKLKGLGLVRDDIKERTWNYSEDTERHIDEPGTAREISWWLTLEPSAVKLASFAKRAGKNEV